MSNNDTFQSGNSNNIKNGDKKPRKKKTSNKARPSGFQGHATASDNIHRKVIITNRNQDTQYVALKTALQVYSGWQDLLWFNLSGRCNVNLTRHSTYQRIDRTNYGVYTANNIFNFRNQDA